MNDLIYTYKVVFGLVNGAANDLFTLTSLIHFTSTRGHTYKLFPHCNSVDLYLNGPDNPRKLPIPLGDLHSHLINGTVGPPKSSSKTACRSVRPFFFTAHRRVSHYFTMGRICYPSKIASSPWGSGPPSNTWYLRPTRVIVGIPHHTAMYV